MNVNELIAKLREFQHNGDGDRQVVTEFGSVIIDVAVEYETDSEPEIVLVGE